jgi:AraC-like DNA-binding protein
LFKFIISSVTTEVAEQNHVTCMIEWISKHQLVILLISKESESLEHRMLQMSEQVRSWIEKHLEFTVTIGIGTAVDQEARISRSFEDAMAAVGRKVTLGLNQIIDSVEVRGKPDGVWFDCLEMIRTLVRGLRMSDQGWKKDIKQLFHEMTALGLGKEEVDRLLHYFIFHLEYELEGALPEAKVWMQKAKPELLLALEQSDTLSQLETGFHGTLERLAGQIEELMLSRRHNVLMREIRDYVAKHFRDPNLSLTMLSDMFQINPKYLSQLFKESIGQNFSDFLIELRIDYAKKLLGESDVSVQDISEMIGYANPPSFNRAFKKIVGMSPSQYREMQGKDQPR